MRALTACAVELLKKELATKSVQEAFQAVETSSAAGGLWRFFSATYPVRGGIIRWNANDLWRGAWLGLSPKTLFFGEDGASVSPHYLNFPIDTRAGGGQLSANASQTAHSICVVNTLFCLRRSCSLRESWSRRRTASRIAQYSFERIASAQ
jgi:hypothetical protein